MIRRKPGQITVRVGFEQAPALLNISQIQPLRIVPETVKDTAKYKQIVSSMNDVGIIEPPVVARDRSEKGKYLLLDGHLRIEVLKDKGESVVSCLISTDDEAYTYNKRVNRLAIVQEHKMILKAVEKGVPESRIAKALNINVSTLRHKIKLLEGICPEAAEILRDKHVASNTFSILRRMVAFRQIEAAELMVAMNKYSTSYAEALLAATPQFQVVKLGKPKVIRGLTDEQKALMERETINLDREFKLAEQTYGSDHLDLVLAKGYLTRLLNNPRVVKFLKQRQQDILGEFQRIAEMESAAA